MSKWGLERVNEQTSIEFESNLRCEENRHRHKHWSLNRDPKLHCPRQVEQDDIEPNWPSINKESVFKDRSIPSLSLSSNQSHESTLPRLMLSAEVWWVLPAEISHASNNRWDPSVSSIDLELKSGRVLASGTWSVIHYSRLLMYAIRQQLFLLLLRLASLETVR